jgi:GDP-L-fucose synthase
VTELFPLAGKRIWVSGHRGLAGAALVRRLASENCALLTVDRGTLDLTRQQPVEEWIARNRPDLIFIAAGRVGGIQANVSHPGSFLYENVLIEANIMEAARRGGIAKLVRMGSSSVYPRTAPQPLTEETPMREALEPTNAAYSIAKIAGLEMADAYRKEYGCDYISATPTNLYGPGDNFDLASSHVLPALIRKAHDAKVRQELELVLWGSGLARREFMHCDDCADALVFLAKHHSCEGHVNVGVGEDVSILELTRTVAEVVGFRGLINCDTTKPDGMPRKLLSIEKLQAMGWRPRIALRDGIASTYRWYLDNLDRLRGV